MIAKGEAAAMGDDLPDLAVFDRVGIRLAVADAAQEVKAAADWVAARAGGAGAAREAAELILVAQGVWTDLVREIRNEERSASTDDDRPGRAAEP